jgi:hypothetical protein
VRGESLPKKLGRPAAGTVKPQVPEQPKRKYKRRSNLVRGAGQFPEGGEASGPT